MPLLLSEKKLDEFSLLFSMKNIKTETTFEFREDSGSIGIRDSSNTIHSNQGEPHGSSENEQGYKEWYQE